MRTLPKVSSHGLNENRRPSVACLARALIPSPTAGTTTLQIANYANINYSITFS